MGFIAIHIIQTLNYDKLVAELVPVHLSIFPIKAKAVHTFDLMTKINLFCRGFIQGLIGSIMSAYTATLTFFHSPYRTEETIHNLETQHGLPRTVLPNCIIIRKVLKLPAADGIGTETYGVSRRNTVNNQTHHDGRR